MEQLNYGLLMKKTIGERIKEIMENLNMTIRGLGNVAGVSPTTIGNYINGKGNLRIDTIGKICIALNVRPFELMSSLECIDFTHDRVILKSHKRLPGSNCESVEDKTIYIQNPKGETTFCLTADNKTFYLFEAISNRKYDDIKHEEAYYIFYINGQLCVSQIKEARRGTKKIYTYKYKAKDKIIYYTDDSSKFDVVGIETHELKVIVKSEHFFKFID
jgi:transcriptional regulator with XRE-family HTH domain